MCKSQYTKELVAKVIIKEIEKQDNPETIESRLFKDYRTLQKIIWKDNKSGYIPDIKAIFSEGTVNIYTIELAGEYNTEKWKLFSLYAKQNEGGLFIVAPEDRLKEIKDTVKNSNINNVHLIYIPEKKQKK